MFIWGLIKRSYVIEDFTDIECHNCSKRSYSAEGIIRYIHIF